MAGDWERLDCLNYQLSREVAAYQTDHLLVVKSCYDFVMGGRMEDLLDLLEERFSVQLGSRYEGVLSEQNMFPS